MSDKQNSMLGHHGQLKSSPDQPLLDGIPAPIFYKDAEGIYRACNTAFAELVLGLPKERIIGSSVYDIPEAIPPELADVYHERDMELIHNPGTQVYEAQVKYTDGLLHDVVFNKSTLIDAAGKVTGMAGVMLDVTERKQLEERERYTTKLRIAAQIAEGIGVVSDIDTTLEAVVTQIQQSFDFYYVHIYLLDDTQENLIIQYGSGETGRKLLEESHTIPISFEHSLVARSARTCEIVMVSDTSQEPDYLSHPLFPNTRSELTFPLITQGELLGVLDIQDDEVSRFVQADIDMLTTLTGQVASALRNARLFEVQARAEQVARESEAESTALLNAVPDMMFRFDKEGNFLDYKAEAGAALIAPPEAFLGKHITEVLPPELARITLGYLQQTLDTGEIVVYEYQSPVGEALRFYEARMAPVGDQEVLSLIRDITDRKEAEVERQRFNLLLGTASEIATQATAILDPGELLDTVIRLLKDRFDLYYAHVYTLDDENKRLVLRAGYGEPGRVMLSSGHHIPLDKEQSLVARAARTHQVVLVDDVKDDPDFLSNPLLPHTKTEIAVPLVVGDHVLGVLDIQHDEPHYFTQAYIDVFNTLAGQIATDLENAYLFEEQHKVRMAIQQSQQRFQDLVETLTDWIWETTGDGVYTYASPQVTQLLGYEPDELVGKTRMDLMSPEEAERVTPLLKELFASKQSIVALETTCIHKDGHLVIFETSGTPYYDADGNYQGYRGTDRDITERKQAEAQILESEERYRLVTQMTEQLIYDFDIVSGQIRWAGAIEALTGYTQEEFALIDVDKWSEFIHPEDRDKALALLDAATEKAVPYNVEYRFRRKDGSYFYVEDHGDFLVDEDGQAYRMLGIQADITVRKQTEAQIRKSEERFRRMAETMHDGLTIIENREIVYISDRLVDILGYSKEELKHMSSFDYAAPEELERLKAFVVASQAGAIPDELAFWIIRKDGQRRYIRNRYSTLEIEDQIIGRFVITTDETDRELAQRSLSESEERLSLALEAANTASWEFRPLDDYVYFGPRWYTMLGYEPNELPQVIGTWSSLLHPDDFTWVDPFIQEHIQEGKDYALDFRMRTKDGNWRWIHAIGKVTERNEDGVAARIVGTHTDITEQRLAEQDRDRQAHIIQSSTDFIAIANSDGKGVYVNAAGLDMIGYTEEEFTGGMSIPDVQPAMPKGAIETAFRDGIWEGESSIVAKDGRVLPVSQTLFTMTVGAEIMLAIIARDITAQKQAEVAIQESERRLSTLMGNLPGMAYRMLNQPDWPAEFISEGSLELTGYKPQELTVGKSHKLNYGDLIHPDDQDWVWEEVQAALAKQESYEIIYRIYNATGELRWAWERGLGVFDDAGNLLSLEGFISDVTASQQAEAERERFTTRLNTAAQISEQVGSILDPDELLHTVIPLIKERFGLYYVHVYTLDEESGMLNLRAGYGEAGEQMLAKGHGIPLDREASLVATAARAREPVLVDDVTENPNFMPNPLLPDTKTEVAVPAIAGGKVLGVFDVQHDEAHYFTQADLDVFQTLTAQIANAFQSAEAFNIAEQERQRAQTYLNMAGSIIVALDKAGDIILLNKAGCDVLGYEEAELLGKNWFDISLPAEIADVVKGVFAQIIAGDIEQTEYYENEVLTRSGEMRIVAWRNSLITDDRGNITGVLSSGEDITERKRAEEEIRTFQTLAEQSTDGILMADLSTQTLTYANQSAYELFGCDYESREMLGKDGALFWAEEELPRLGSILEQAVREGWQGDVLQRRLDGSTFAANATTFVLRDAEGNPTQLVIMVRDITERKHAEKVLQESEQKLSDALRIAKMANWEFDVEAQTFLFNDQYYRTFHNATAEEVGGYEMSAATFAQRFVVPEDASDVAKNIQMALGSTNPDFQLQTESRNLTIDGKEVWASIWLTTEKDKTGKTTKLYGVNQDITERKQVEAERERFATRLNTAAQISEQVGSILDPDELLQTVIPLIKEQFGLYYVHVYTFDEESGMLNLRAGYGEAGEKMLAEGHSIPLDREASLVATAARTKEPVLVDDVTENPNFMPNPLLPDTKTEVAVPSIAGGKVLGVFDVQHDEAHYFTQADLDVFQTLAAQIANAFRSAELFAEQEILAAELKESEAQFRETVNRSLAGIYRSNPAGDMLEANPALLEITYFESLAALNEVGLPNLYVNPDDRARFVELTTKGPVKGFETQYRRGDGTVIDVSLSSNPVFDDSGNLVILEGVLEDITARKQVEAERERFTARLNTAAQISEQVGSILDPDELLHTVIPLIKEQFGLYYVHVYTLDEESGMLNLRAGYGEAGEKMLAEGHSIPLDREASLVATAARTRKVVLVDDVTENPNFMPNPLLPDTKTEVAVPSIAGGKVLGVFDVQHDKAHYFTQADLDVFQTLAAQIANAFRSAELFNQAESQRALYNGILTNLPTAVFAVDSKFGLLVTNEAAQKLLGRQMTDKEGNVYVEQYDVVYYDTGARFPEGDLPLVKANTLGGQHATNEMAVRHPDGTLIPLLVNAGPLADPTGEQMGAVVTFTDMTEQRRAQEEVERYLEQTESRLRVSQALAGAEIEEDVLNVMVEQAALYSHVQITISLLDPAAATPTFVLNRTVGFDTTLTSFMPLGTRIPADHFPMLKLIEDNEVFISPNAIEDPRVDEVSRKTLLRSGSVSLAIIPVLAGRELLGIFVLFSEEEDYFDEHKMFLYQMLVDQSADAILAARLRGQLNLTRFSVDRGPAAIYWLRPDASIYDVNDTACQMLGYTRDELLSIERFTDLDPNFPPDAWVAHWEDLKEQRRMTIQTQHQSKDGHIIPVEVEINYIQYGDLEFNCAFARDITERLEAERAIQESQRLLQEFLDNFPDLAFAKDTEGHIILANKALYASFPTPDGKLMGKTVYDLVPEEIADGIWQSELKILEAGEVVELEEVVPQEDGVHTKLTTKFPLYNTEGHVMALGGVSIDITERKRAEMELARFAGRLNTASEIAQQVGSILDPDELLHTVIPLIKEQFDLYYVHVYTLDEESGMLNLRAGYGEAGEKMLAEGHSIPLDREASLVATAARTRKVVLVDDVTENPNFMPNPLLPDTKTEVAVPSIAGGKVLGVFDVQHDEAHYFTQADLDVFQTLAAQIANAFRSAELFNQAESQRALYDGILTNLPTAVFAVDNKFGLLVTNEAAQKLLGRQMTDKEGNVYVEQYDVVYYDTGERFPEGDLPLVKANTLGGQHATNEMAVRHPDGTLIPLLVNAGPLADPTGEQMGAVVTFTDMTEQRKAQEEVERYLEQTEIRLQVSQALADAQTEEAVLDAMVEQAALYSHVRITINLMDTEADTPTFTIDRSVGFETAVQSFIPVGMRIPAAHFSMLQLVESGDAFVSPNVMEDSLVDDASRQVLQRSGVISLAVLPITSGRELLGLFVLLSEEENYFDNRKMFLYQTLVDESTNAIDAARLRDRLQLTMASVEQSQDSYFWFDADARFTDVTARTCEVLGYERDELLAMKIFDIDPSFPPEAWPGLKSQVKEGGVATVESFHRTKDGRAFPVEVTVSRLEFEEQETYFSIARDITERKAAQVERERFINQLGTAAEISTQINTILDPDALLEFVVPLVKERFDLYHVHFYELNMEEQSLVMKAGYGKVGEIMRQQGHKIALDRERSLVARAARAKAVVVVNDVQKEEGYLPNMLLPNTHAEVALPAMVGDHVLGVLDVQADQPDYFTSSDLDVFRTMVSQIATALQNARSFEQQRLAEAEVRKSAETIRAMFDAITDGITVTNMMGEITDLNQASLELFGQTKRDDLLGHNTMELVASEQRSKVAESFSQALETGNSGLLEFPLLRKDGKVFAGELTAALLRDEFGNPMGFINVSRDITERIRAQQERDRFTTQLQTASDVAAQINTILEPEKLLSTVVPQIKEQFDLYHVHVYTLNEEAGELVMRFGSGEPGRIMREEGHKISLLEENSLVAQAARTGNPVVVNDVTQDPNFMPNPLLPDTRSEVAVPVSIGGQILGVVDVQDDEPDRFTKSDINVFTTLAAQIAAALQNARLFNEIQLTADRLREVDRLKSEFLANMSHELRTPMNSILGYTEVLLMGIDGDLDPEMLQDVEAIYENGQHLLRLINDVLDLAKIEAGRMSLTMEEVYVDLLLDEVKTSNIGLLHKRQTPVEFVVEAEEDLPPIQADRIRLSQILNNLVSNAVKFTEKGYIWLRAYQDDSWVCIEVEDTGIGISQEDMGKLFERFQQVDGSTTRRAEGTGLGLSITRHLVEMHGGKIEVFSDVDQGSKFLIRLPIPGSAPDSDPEAVIE